LKTTPRKVKELSISLRGVVFNRVHQEAAAEFRSLDEQWLIDLVSKNVRSNKRSEELVHNFLRYETLARGDQLRIEAFRKQLPARTAITTVPNFNEDLHDLDGLRQMIPHLLAA
jgi:hypothetical protein